MAALVALAPIALALVLMVGLRWPATRAMPLSWLATVAGALLLWKLPPLYVAALTLHGFITAASVLVIVFGALVILYTLEQGGALETIQWGMKRVSADSRVQAIIIGCMFAAFIEAAAGFGTPAALAAPLLVSLRFPPLAAATLCLVFNSFPVTFGSVGTPVLLGLEYARPVAEAAGIGATAFNHGVGRWAALLHAPMIVLLPLLMLALLTRGFGERRRFGEGLGAWRIALLGSLCFGVPYVALALLAGPEFPSLVGGLLGLGGVIIGARSGLVAPRGEPWTFGASSSWPEDWIAIDDGG
ncbi:MAG: L-lactate permease, partial [Myxococcales bacterium]|nr:L-lactate permease [Myxococcales bacterium]